MKWPMKNRGFTLLLAALVAAIAFSLGSSIYSIVSKELALSSIGQDSQFAFYAADTVAECALYWDSRIDKLQNAFATSTTDTDATPQSIECDGVGPSLVQTQAQPNAATTTFEIENLFATTQDPTRSGYCADVEVGKSADRSGVEHTIIVANGYSVDCAAIPTAPNALQRTVELQY